MERNEISVQEARAYVAFVKATPRWLTNRELATEAEIAERTARAFTSKFVSLGLVDQAEVFPAHRFRIAEKAEKRNKAYVGRLRGAVEVFGLQQNLS